MPKGNKMLVVFDIDGTLADNHHRIDYVRTTPKDWAKYDAGIHDDAVIEPIAKIFRLFVEEGHAVVFATGRNERSRTATELWLAEHNLRGGEHLYMRAANDFRHDDVVKSEMLDQIIADYGKKPDMWFDDRPRVVRALRERGVFVVDVYQGEEEF